MRAKMLVERVVANAREARDWARLGENGGECLGAESGLLDVGSVPVAERVPIDLPIRERLQPPMKDGQIGFALRRREPHEGLPERTPHLPSSAVVSDDARA